MANPDKHSHLPLLPIKIANTLRYGNFVLDIFK